MNIIMSRVTNPIGFPIILTNRLASLATNFCEAGTKLKDFLATQSAPHFQSEISKLRHDVEEYAKQFPTIGFEKETMKYKN